jgi:hypothetical protein
MRPPQLEHWRDLFEVEAGRGTVFQGLDRSPLASGRNTASGTMTCQWMFRLRLDPTRWQKDTAALSGRS